jgi:hypothetical protein
MTIVDVAVSVGSATLLIGVVSATAAALRPASGTAVSMANSMQLGAAHALYAMDHNGLQWCTHKTEFGLTGGNCSQYLALDCPPQVILGMDLFGGVWGYYVGGTGCVTWFPGNCGNWVMYQPMDFSVSPGAGYGGWRMMAIRSFHDYLNGRYFDPTFWAPNDRSAYRAASPNFSYPGEFIYSSATFQWSSYAMSSSAMWDPQVFRSPSQGGFRSPSSFADAYRRQALFGAAHPELKTLVLEHNWCQGGTPPMGSFGSTPTTYAYNASASATPVALFYDGHVWTMSNAQAIADDASLIKRGLDGLWSRDTPFGQDGYLGAQSIDGSRTSHSVLTTDGILGRDVLTPQ